MKVRC